MLGSLAAIPSLAALADVAALTTLADVAEPTESHVTRTVEAALATLTRQLRASKAGTEGSLSTRKSRPHAAETLVYLANAIAALDTAANITAVAQRTSFASAPASLADSRPYRSGFGKRRNGRRRRSTSIFAPAVAPSPAPAVAPAEWCSSELRDGPPRANSLWRRSSSRPQ